MYFSFTSHYNFVAINVENAERRTFLQILKSLDSGYTILFVSYYNTSSRSAGFVDAALRNKKFENEQIRYLSHLKVPYKTPYKHQMKKFGHILNLKIQC